MTDYLQNLDHLKITLCKFQESAQACPKSNQKEEEILYRWKLNENVRKPRDLWKCLKSLGLSSGNNSPSKICSKVKNMRLLKPEAPRLLAMKKTSKTEVKEPCLISYHSLISEQTE